MAAQDEASRSEELGESRLLEDPGITGGSLPRSSSSEALLREFVRIRSHNQLWFAGFLSCMVVFVPAIVTMALRKSSSPTQSLPSRPTPLVIQEQALAVPAGPADVFRKGLIVYTLMRNNLYSGSTIITPSRYQNWSQLASRRT